MDATVATGAAAMMAIRVLLDHDVPEQNITLCSLIMAETGKCISHFPMTNTDLYCYLILFHCDQN